MYDAWNQTHGNWNNGDGWTTCYHTKLSEQRVMQDSMQDNVPVQAPKSNIGNYNSVV